MTVARIVALAAAIPKEQINILDLGFDEYTIKRTMRLTGVQAVRYAPADKTALDYALAAAQQILDRGYVDRDAIDGVIFVTPHPDYDYPGNCSIIQSRLRLTKRCIALDINHSCTGLIYGLYMANLLVRTAQCKNVLVCCGDTASHHLNPQDRALRMVVGDGGVAALVSAGGTLPAAYAFQHDGDGLEYLYTPAGGERMPARAGITDIPETDVEGNVRTLEDEYMDGMQVMKYVVTEVPPLIDEVLAAQGWAKETVDVYSFHQANAYMVKTLARNMHLPKGHVLYDIDGNGNIGGGSIALALCHAAMQGEVKRDRTIMAGFGAGLSIAAMAADLSATELLPVNEI